MKKRQNMGEDNSRESNMHKDPEIKINLCFERRTELTYI